MNHKHKLGYTLLGAGITAVGITIEQAVTPEINAPAARKPTPSRKRERR